MLTGIDYVIETNVATQKIGYIEAVIDFAKEKEIDVDDVVEMLCPTIIEKIKTEFVKKNFFSKNKIENSLESFV